MSVRYNTNLASSGLLYSFDVGSVKSFPGHPTTNIISTQSLPIATYAYVTGPVLTSALDAENKTRTVYRYTITQVINTARAAIYPAVSISTNYTFSCIMRYNGLNVSIPTFVVSAAKPFPETVGNSIALSQSVQTTTSLGNGWYYVVYRFTISSNTTSACILTFGVSTGSDSAYLNKTFDVYNIQLEQKAYPTAYTPTSRPAILYNIANTSLNGTINGSPFNASGLTFPNATTADNVTITTNAAGINPRNGTIISWVRPTSSVWGLWQTGASWTNAANQSCIMAYPGGTFYYRIVDSGGTIRDVTVTTSTFFPTNTWHHLAFAWSHSSMLFYKNGVLIGSKYDNLSSLGASGMNTGYIGVGHDHPMTGDIDQFHVWNRPLAYDELLSNYNSTRSRYGL